MRKTQEVFALVAFLGIILSFIVTSDKFISWQALLETIYAASWMEIAFEVVVVLVIYVSCRIIVFRVIALACFLYYFISSVSVKKTLVFSLVSMVVCAGVYGAWIFWLEDFLASLMTMVTAIILLSLLILGLLVMAAREGECEARQVKLHFIIMPLMIFLFFMLGFANFFVLAVIELCVLAGVTLWLTSVTYGGSRQYSESSEGSDGSDGSSSIDVKALEAYNNSMVVQQNPHMRVG